MLRRKERSRQTFEEKITQKKNSTQESYQTMLNRWDLFGKEKFNSTDLIPELKLVDQDTLWDSLQEWINWNVDVWSPQVNKSKFGQLKKYLHHRGIKLSKEDIEDNLDFPMVVKVEKYPLSLEETQQIMTKAPYKKETMYLCQLSSGMRIGELLQLKPKHLDFSKKRIMVKIPSSIAKFNKARTTFFSWEAEKLLRPLIKKLDADERIFGTHYKVKSSEANEFQQLKRLLQKIGLYEKQENGQGKITSHGFRAYFITKVSRVDRDLAYFLAGQGDNKVYLPEYDRLTDDEKLDLYLKIEPDLLIHNNSRQKTELAKLYQEKSELEKINEEKTNLLENYKKLEARTKRLESIAKKQPKQ